MYTNSPAVNHDRSRLLHLIATSRQGRVHMAMTCTQTPSCIPEIGNGHCTVSYGAGRLQEIPHWIFWCPADTAGIEGLGAQK